VSAAAEPPPGGPPNGRRGQPPQNIATAIAEVSERATDLVHEEIELAKAEIAEKIGQYLRSAIIAAVAGVFVLMAVILALVGGAWLIYWGLPVETYEYFWGFFVMAALLLVVGAIAGMVAAKIVKRAAPPVPAMAIDEAKKIRDTVSAPEGNLGVGAATQPPGPVGAPKS
jgi:uncharacterized membrane protein YqjE